LTSIFRSAIARPRSPFWGLAARRTSAGGALAGLYAKASASLGELDFSAAKVAGDIATHGMGRGFAMKSKVLGVALTVALLGASSSVYAQSGWTFTTIDNPAAITGAGGTFAQGINDPGQVVGYFDDSTGTHGFSKTGSSFTTLNYPDAPLTTYAEGINNKGDVVGWYNGSVAGYINPNPGNHGFLYSGGVYTAINDPSATNTYAHTDTYAQGINNKDQIVGFYQNYPRSGVINRGFLYSGGQYIPLDDPSSNLNKIGGSNTDNFGSRYGHQQ
jgi:probable HAF family extracellular repeat protein